MNPCFAEYYFEDLDAGLPFSLPRGEITIEELFETAAGVLGSLGPTVLGDIGQGVEIEGAVFIGQGSKVQSGVRIVGPAWIGQGVQVGHGALVRAGSIIGDGCTIGHCAEVKSSVLMQGAKAQSHTFVGDSVLGRGVRVGSGTIVANRRFDQGEIPISFGTAKMNTRRRFLGALVGDYVRLGANSTTLPGAVIGPYSLVFPGVAVQGFVPRASHVSFAGELQITQGKEKRLEP